MSGEYLDIMGTFTNPAVMRQNLPPIIEYLELYSRGATLYPRQSTLLKIIFLDVEHMTDYDHWVIKQWLHSTEMGGEVVIPLDIYARMDWCIAHGYKHFTTVINCGGRRGGKGFIGGKIGEYLTAQMISCGSPQRHFGLEESKEMYVDVFATQYSQAQGMLYNDIKDAILEDDWLAPYIYSTSNGMQRLQTPYDRVREERIVNQAIALGRKNRMNASIASLVVKPWAASSTSIRGHAAYLQCFDEFAHGLDTSSSMSSSAIYEAATPSVMQCGTEGMVYIPSSPWSEVGKFYQLYNEAFKMDGGVAVHPEYFAIRWPSWASYEDWEYDVRKKRAIILPPSKSQEMRSKQLQNPDSFNVEFGAHFAKTEDAYMNPNVVESLFKPFPSEEENKNLLVESGNIMLQYRAHADAGRSQDNFCFAMGHKEIGPDGFWHVYFDVMHTWQPQDFPEDETGVCRVDYTVVIKWLVDTFKHFSVYKYTMDQWNSALVIDQMRQEALMGNTMNGMMHVEVENHTATSNFVRWEAFKTACYQGWVHIPYFEEFYHKVGRKCCLPELEMKFMIIKNGNKVTWPEVGEITHGDMADCLSTVVADLLSEQINDLNSDNLTKVVGAAQGGYNDDMKLSNSDMIERGLQLESQRYYEQMGYGRY